MGRLSTSWLFEPVALQFPDEYFDFVCIDGDHRYAAVKEDLELYFKKLKFAEASCEMITANLVGGKVVSSEPVDEFASNNIVKIVSYSIPNSVWRKRIGC